MSEIGGRRAALRWGLAIAVLLGVLTILELVVAALLPGFVMLAIIALLKAGVIIKEYMHIGLVFEGGDEQ